MWVRGLKRSVGSRQDCQRPSHPMWVRGLKLFSYIFLLNATHVAPYVGAWIETYLCYQSLVHLQVAPYVGAWIETTPNVRDLTLQLSHPMWVRGLKPLSCCPGRRAQLSHPMWVRGLKLPASAGSCSSIRSHPMWVRGLKQLKPNTKPTRHCRTLCGCVD